MFSHKPGFPPLSAVTEYTLNWHLEGTDLSLETVFSNPTFTLTPSPGLGDTGFLSLTCLSEFFLQYRISAFTSILEQKTNLLWLKKCHDD